eukprot:CAMPEP_0119045042 /NCGR_PEP_ID=MMETSP1177-20130426/36563_1 /TAXON_ID=2985 /ORGANISM="Ochromonas sp, Strain CCMP1899" /LENGTH=604 /DNA_ID=CAMNT_0007016123 /DNA_START=163 /DNA_END=1974 /DNA_ORIENTATION=+
MSQNVQEFGLSTENSFLKYLNQENSEGLKQHSPRQIYKSHYTAVNPESVPSPYMVAASESCAKALGLNPSEFRTPLFIKGFTGNEVIPGLDAAYCSNYGCHCYSSWFGQLGDGRAMALGEVLGEGGERYELQLKGSGRSPYSRGFDGRAVLRSSVREYLVSEAMFHLGVSTTRALSVIGTGQTIRRPWYDVNAKDMKQCGGQNRGRFAPDVMVPEPGAILTRVSKSFLRFAQLELFAIREEYPELVQLANHVCLREFPQLLSTSNRGITNTEEAISVFNKDDLKQNLHSEVYVAMFREIVQKNAALVADWQRVGYTQGNMNSDNTLLGGRTIDYGPFGWMEKYDPMYQPFTSDPDGKFAFIRQPTAMGVNIAVLAETSIIPLLKYVCKDSTHDIATLTAEIKHIVEKEYSANFLKNYKEVIRKKLGLKSFVDENNETMKLWIDLSELMAKSKVDYTILFRELSLAASQVDCNDALMVLEPAFYEPCLHEKISQKISPRGSTGSSMSIDCIKKEREGLDLDANIEAWCTWFETYLRIIKAESRNPTDRIKEMNETNPKYVLRNWMSLLAYEAAKEGDYSVVQELHELLTDPYDMSLNGPNVDEKW